ncbi:hypothetical protein ACFY3G_38095 [Streptomyces phaeochromogenes]|uniref:hypothetical protein n=1 Tax=Streptomyces phaeochromogenes TaxID=1923 RepID=UPI0036A28618
MATAALVMLGAPAVAQPEPEPSPSGALGGVVYRAVEDVNAPTEPLPPGALDEVINEWRQWRLAHDNVVAKFHSANPAWVSVTWNDVHDFAMGVCQGNGGQAAATLLQKLPGVQLAHASLLVEAVALVPLHCALPSTQTVDAAGGTLADTVLTQTANAGTAALTQAPASATRDLSPGMMDLVNLPCAVGGGVVGHKIGNTYKANLPTRYGDLAVAAGAALGGLLGNKCEGAIGVAVDIMQSGS